MAQGYTVQIMAKIDISPNGVTLVFEGMDTNLANLLNEAGTFTVQPPQYETVTTSVLTIQSDKKISFT